MADDFLPRGDQEFCLWLRNFLKGTARGGRMTRLKLSSEELERLRDKSAALEEAMGQQRQFLRQAAAARVSKDGLRRQCEKRVRQLARQLQRSFAITSTDKADLGLRVPKARLGSAAANQPPATSPWLRVQSLPRRHLLHFVDEKTPSRKIKPPRVAICEIERKCLPVAGRGRPRRSPKQVDWQFLALCSATPQAVVHAPEETGTLVSYRCRWLTRRGKAGPWSNTVTALVGD